MPKPGDPRTTGQSTEANPPAKHPATDRLGQVFRFLKELNTLRNPVPMDLSGYFEVLRLDAWPSHPCVSVRRGDRLDDSEVESGATMEPVIRIKRPQLTACPKPPSVLDDWLKPGWQSPEAPAEVLASRNLGGRGKKTKTTAFSDDPQRLEAFESWTAIRAKWAEAEKPPLEALKIFERVHTLWTTIQREAERVELVLADGMLWVPDSHIRHPVLLQRVALEFDPSVPEFQFHTGTETPALNRALLRLVPAIEGRMIAHFDTQLEATPVEPLGGESTGGFLRTLIQGFFTDGIFLEKTAEASTTTRPCIWREPVIFLRPRTAGLASSLDNILEDLEEGKNEAPLGLARIVGVDGGSIPQNAGQDAIDPTRPTPLSVEPDILFSKPANSAQYEIAARLAQAKSVLVQGPPGTGKTHTIANLLGYLLAQGKTVLVTAHTTKALRVLRRQVDEALQPLCLSVLESDAESQAQLSQSAQHIAERLSRSNAASLRGEAAALRAQRLKLLNEANDLRRQLRAARFSELEEIVLAGEGTSPIDAAKRVKADAERDGWIPAPIEPLAPCPLTDSEVRDLYATQVSITPADEAQLAIEQPALEHLVSPADFRLLAEEQAGAGARAKTHRPDLWPNGVSGGHSATHLQQLHQRVCAAAGLLVEEQSWLREVLFAGWMGGGLRDTWSDLVTAADSLANLAGEAHRLVTQHGPELPSGPPIHETAATLGEIIEHLEKGGTLGFLTKMTKRGWHQLAASCRVDGRAPTTLEEFRSLHALAQLEEHRTRFTARWRRAVESIGGPTVESLGRMPERTAHGYSPEILSRLEWREKVWEPLIGELRHAGFDWDSWLAAHPPVPGDHGELARVQRAGSLGLAEIVEAQAALLRQQELANALLNQRAWLAAFPQSEAAQFLLRAQDSWNSESYEEACRELARLQGLRGTYETRVALLAKIEPVAAAWMHAVSRRQKPHLGPQPPGDLAAAWKWRQLHQELEARASVSMPDLQERLDRTEKALRQLAAQIIERETWASQCERTGLQAQQALMGFVQTIRKIGKGTGKRVPELLRHARQLLASARSAVPVWIMPLSRVHESFDPRVTKFDVVIIDEASQSDVTALAALYLGREHVVVGDKEQVTPDAVGQKIDDVQRLISTDLLGIPNSHLYDGQTSIYDLAETAFGGVIALREHFRCVPEIIQFSNHLSYQTIIPLREPHSAPVKPAVVSHRVNGHRHKTGKTNEIEAEEIASLLIACLEDPAYALNESRQPTSFGVISLLGDEQALLIENILRTRVTADVFAKHRILCGNAAQFQGDERDVVFLSMVDGPPDEGPHAMRGAGPKDLFKKRYNVAVSRARNQLWVVHSLDPEAHLQPGDLRRRLIDHARDPQALLRAMEKEGRKTESVFEKMVLQRLIDAGYRVQTQWPVGARRIDLVVEGHSKRLAVECDGEKWHTPENLHQYLERQAILERLGWTFVRVRGSVFFRDPDAALAPVFAKLQHLGIEPLGSPQPPTATEVIPLLERIRRQASLLRAQWRNEKRISLDEETSN